MLDHGSATDEMSQRIIPISLLQHSKTKIVRGFAYLQAQSDRENEGKH